MSSKSSKDRHQNNINIKRSNNSFAQIKNSSKNSDDRLKNSVSNQLKKVYSQKNIISPKIYKFDNSKIKKLKLKSIDRSDISKNNLLSPKKSDSRIKPVKILKKNIHKSPDNKIVHMTNSNNNSLIRDPNENL